MSPLDETTFVVVGLGGLGCPVTLGLGAAGARRLHLIDHDRVERSNLHRQVLYNLGDVGHYKALAAASALRRRHRALRCEAKLQRLTPNTIGAALEGLDGPAVVLECTDSPALKFAANDLCLAHAVPLVIGAAVGLAGQAMAIQRPHACYRCIYENPPPAEAVPTCEAAGVLGPAVGAVGAVMASLAIDLASGRKETAGRLLSFSFATSTVRELRPSARPECSGCAAPHLQPNQGEPPWPSMVPTH